MFSIAAGMARRGLVPTIFGIQPYLIERTLEQIKMDTDNFQKIKDVRTNMLFGSQEKQECPWITVIIPTFCRKESLADAIQSVLCQQNAAFQWEVIVVDNTPFDANRQTPALKIVKELKNQRVQYFHNEENLGPGYNWNRGVELARGEWVCFLHDDDVLCRDALQQIGRLLKNGRKSNKRLGYLNACRVEFRDDFGTHTSSDFKRQPQEVLTRFGVLVCGHTGAGAPTCGTTVLKKAYMEAGGINYDFGPSADAVLCYQIMRKYDVVTTDCIIGGYRWNENATLNKQTLLDFIRADDLLMAYAYHKNSRTACWGRWFGDAVSWRNIWRKNNTAVQNKIRITQNEFAAACRFSEPTFLKKQIYLAIYATYRFMRKLTGYLYVLLSG